MYVAERVGTVFRSALAHGAVGLVVVGKMGALFDHHS